MSPFENHSELDLENLGSEAEDYESVPAEYQITTYPADFTLEVLHNKWKSEEIRIPKFQRGYVWKPQQASKLIESFLVGLPVPAVFMYIDHESQKYQVIDGQQRLKSVFYYFDGAFPQNVSSIKKKEFELNGLSENSRFYGKSFQDLSNEDQLKLKNAVLRSFIVQQITSSDNTGIYQIFERLNTGGTLLSNQEIRNCLFDGKFSEFLDEINNLKSWRSILGKQEHDLRKRDVELILRFLALQNLTEYSKPMKEYLSLFMSKHRNPKDEDLKENYNMFENTCEAVIDSLGQKPFHVRSGLNAAVFDSVMTAFSKHLDSIPKDIHRRYSKLTTENDDFRTYTNTATTDSEVIKKRFRLANKVLFET